MCFSIVCIDLSKKQKIGKKSRNIVSSKKCKKKQMQGFPLARNPREKQQQQQAKCICSICFLFYFVHFFSLFVHFCSVL
jgi:hypothetical protein